MKAQSAVLAIALAGVLAAGAPARAERVWREPQVSWDYTADGRLVDVQIEVDGRIMPLYRAPGRSDRQYFEALKGRNYALVIRNNTAERVGVLIAVDGLNVVNGELSRLSRNEPMYVLDPYETATIRGWRTSLQNVRRFVFVDEERSYAERTGQSNSDLGWVRVLAFREQRLTWRLPQLDLPYLREREELRGGEPVPQGALPESKAGTAPAPSAGEAQKRSLEESRMMAERDMVAPHAEQSVPGTGWGERRYDPVRETVFTAQSYPTDHLVLRYEYASGLQALGIFPARGPDRVWERDHRLGFAQPPRW